MCVECVLGLHLSVCICSEFCMDPAVHPAKLCILNNLLLTLACVTAVADQLCQTVAQLLLVLCKVAQGPQISL